MAKYDDNDGVWRTIGGRRVFIKKGQSMSDAMKESGKFKIANKKIESKSNGSTDSKIKQLYHDTWEGKKDYSELKQELDELKKSGKATDKDIEEVRKQTQEEYNKQHSATSYYSKMNEKEMREDLEDRKSKLDNNFYNEKDRKMYQDFYNQGKFDYENWYGKKEYNEKEIETISKEEYDKLPKEYKGTIKGQVDTAEFRGEKKEDVIKKYKDLGYDVENDKTILKLTDKGTTLTPVKVVNTSLSNDKAILEKHNLVDNDPSFKRQMLGRMESDIKYYLGNGNGNERHLWAGNEDDHIQIMKSLYNTLPDKEKPEWLTMDKINDYEKQMKEVKGNSSLISRYAGTIDYMKNSTGLNMSQIIEIIKKMDKERNK